MSTYTAITPAGLGEKAVQVSDVTSKQIADTLANMRAELRANGPTAAADTMWMHALVLYRRAKGIKPPPPERVKTLGALARRHGAQ